MTARPEHDPLSEEMDLITWQEAAARLHDESLALRSEIETLSSQGDDDAARSEIAALKTRLAAMGRVAERLTSQRPTTSRDRTPNLPS